VGGGMIMPAVMTILTTKAGPQRMGRVMGILGMPMLLAPMLGPILGGWLVDDVSWRWIFYVNVPIGAVALALALRVLPRDRPQPSHRLDALGLALLSPGLAATVYGLSETASNGGIGSVRAWLPIVVGLVLVAAFARHALRTPHALIDLRLFTNRTVAASALTSVLFGAAFFGAMLLLPLYYQILRGTSALDAGLLLAPQGLGAMVTMAIGGRATDRTGAGRIVLVGLALTVLGTAAFTQVGPNTSEWLLGAALFVRGMGMGATMMPAMSAAFQTLTPAAVARATTALNIVQRVGGSIGIAVLAVVLQHEITTRPHTPAAVGTAFGHTFWWALVLTALAFAPALMLPRKAPTRREDPTTSDEEAVALAA